MLSDRDSGYDSDDSVKRMFVGGGGWLRHDDFNFADIGVDEASDFGIDTESTDDKTEADSGSPDEEECLYIKARVAPIEGNKKIKPSDPVLSLSNKSADQLVRDNLKLPLLFKHYNGKRIGTVTKIYRDATNQNLMFAAKVTDKGFIRTLRTASALRWSAMPKAQASWAPVIPRHSSDGFVPGLAREKPEKTFSRNITAKKALVNYLAQTSATHFWKDPKTESYPITEISLCMAGRRDRTSIVNVRYNEGKSGKAEAEKICKEVSTMMSPDVKNKNHDYAYLLLAVHGLGSKHHVDKAVSDLSGEKDKSLLISYESGDSGKEEEEGMVKEFHKKPGNSKALLELGAASSSAIIKEAVNDALKEHGFTSTSCYQRNSKEAASEGESMAIPTKSSTSDLAGHSNGGVSSTGAFIPVDVIPTLLKYMHPDTAQQQRPPQYRYASVDEPGNQGVQPVPAQQKAPVVNNYYYGVEPAAKKMKLVPENESNDKSGDTSAGLINLLCSVLRGNTRLEDIPNSDRLDNAIFRNLLLSHPDKTRRNSETEKKTDLPSNAADNATAAAVAESVKLQQQQFEDLKKVMIETAQQSKRQDELQKLMSEVTALRGQVKQMKDAQQGEDEPSKKKPPKSSKGETEGLATKEGTYSDSPAESNKVKYSIGNSPNSTPVPVTKVEFRDALKNILS